MAINFHSPSFRASSSDLTIAISPLGLVELSDEEFEVHGPRLNRYAHHWAWYLGHHWSHRRELGEAQLTMNYVRALADYLVNFTFGKGITFRSPPATEAIVPSLLRRVWTTDNNMEKLLWEIGVLGGVCGDVFVKIAYEPPYKDPGGFYHPGKVRILPLNPAHVYPEWHPHDRSRLMRVKLKYRFWGSLPEGTRSVNTYVEVISEESISEFVNDQLIEERPNPLGQIPIVHIPNIPVPGSPWGLADVHDIISLNREYNEKATEISDIINYHSEPVTIITGAKSNQLERGAKKIWAGLPKDANVFNLSLDGELASPLEYLNLIKRTMHELTGVPEGALGQLQPISNTSGVALAIQFQPVMNKVNQKHIMYGTGLERVNELVLRHLAIYEPDTFIYNPQDYPPIRDGQVEQLDPMDPLTYRSIVHWPPPLPIDQLVKLNEIQGKMALGIESKRGALRELGEEFPDEKLQELFSETRQDTIAQGAISMLNAQVAAAITAATGIMPEGAGEDVTQAGGDGVTSADDATGLGGPVITPEVMEMYNEVVTLAMGTKIPQRRNPDKTD